MRKSSSLHDLTSQDKDISASLASSRFLSCSGDRLDILSSGTGRGSKSTGGLPTNPYFTIPRTSWPSRVHPSSPLLTAPAAHPSLFNSSSSLSSTSSTNSATHRGSFDDRSPSNHRSSAGREHSRHYRERSASLKEFPTHLTLPRESGSLESIDRRTVSVGSALRPEVPDDLSQSMSADETDSNETDELKVRAEDYFFYDILTISNCKSCSKGKKKVIVGSHLDICELIWFNLGTMMNTTELYILILGWVPLTLI